MKIVHCSDIHFGTEDPEIVRAMESRITEIEPDLIVASGDFTMAGRAREFAGASSLLRRLGKATGSLIVATPGNHDLPVYDLISRFVRPLGRYRRWMGPVSQRAFVDERVAVLSLNSARPWDFSLNWSNGRLSTKQILEADRFFAAAADVPFRALVVHHPFHVPEALPGFRRIGRCDEMLDVLARRRVHAVLSGHLHLREVIARDMDIEADRWTVRLVQAGTATSVRERDGSERNSFNLLRIGLPSGADGGDHNGRGAGMGGVPAIDIEPQGWDGVRFVAGDPAIRSA